MALPPKNPWYKPLIRELHAGRMMAAEAARMAGVSKVRIGQWCHAAGFNPIEARERYLTIFYARELLLITKRERVKGKVAPNMKAKVPRRKPRKSVDKTAARAVIDSKVIDFAQRGGEIKRIPKGKRTLRPL